MTEQDWLAGQFEAQRPRLRKVAYRMLGSLSEADDAVQDAWLRISRADANAIENVGGWLTTAVARVCLDMLRARKSRREESLGQTPEPVSVPSRAPDAEQEAVLADSVGLALLVVLERLAPAERIAFVLHDMFDLSFDEIAPIVARTPAAARQLASRARRRVRGGPTVPDAMLLEQRKVVDAFVAALRAGDFEALVSVLDPDVVVRADQGAAAGGTAQEVHGARTWAKTALTYARGATAARVALVDGGVGLVIAPRGQLFRVLTFTVANGKIARIDVVGDKARLGEMEIGLIS
jgi:RNA polymerase sigma factor (sigma-70 family)